MKNNISTKVIITVPICIVSLAYLFGSNLLYGRTFLSDFLPFLFTHWWFVIITAFVLVFVYPYIKIDSQSILKRGLFFGAVAWIVNFPQILMDLKETIMLLDMPRIILFLEKPIYFLILGIFISFFYKKFLTEEFNLSLIKLKLSFAKIILAIVITTLFYSVFMYLSEFLIINIFSTNPYALKMNFSDFLTIFLYINPLIYGLIFTVFYIKTIRKIDVSKIKKIIIFTVFLSVFADPLVIKSPDYYFADIYIEIFISNLRFALLIPHLLSVLIIGYILIKFLDRGSFTRTLPEIKNKL